MRTRAWIAILCLALPLAAALHAESGIIPINSSEVCQEYMGTAYSHEFYACADLIKPCPAPSADLVAQLNKQAQQECASECQTKVCKTGESSGPDCHETNLFAVSQSPAKRILSTSTKCLNLPAECSWVVIGACKCSCSSY
jgi:hypothetical protein